MGFLFGKSPEQERNEKAYAAGREQAKKDGAIGELPESIGRLIPPQDDEQASRDAGYDDEKGWDR